MHALKMTTAAKASNGLTLRDDSTASSSTAPFRPLREDVPERRVVFVFVYMVDPHMSTH